MVLTDLQTKKAVDLKEESMSFVGEENADDASRFVLTFKAIEDVANDAIRAYDTSEGLAVEGLCAGDRVFVYDSSGRVTDTMIASSAIEYIQLERNIYIVKVVRNEMKDWVGKVSVK